MTADPVVRIRCSPLRELLTVEPPPDVLTPVNNVQSVVTVSVLLPPSSIAMPRTKRYSRDVEGVIESAPGSAFKSSLPTAASRTRSAPTVYSCREAQSATTAAANVIVMSDAEASVEPYRLYQIEQVTPLSADRFCVHSNSFTHEPVAESETEEWSFVSAPPTVAGSEMLSAVTTRMPTLPDSMAAVVVSVAVVELALFC
ncbi:MAG: hypothetical protein ACRDY6_13690 [Acidimicrobiia bacterium]